jgi:hypothetical protein
LGPGAPESAATKELVEAEAGRVVSEGIERGVFVSVGDLQIAAHVSRPARGVRS